jgi:cell division transport system permease protein
MSRDSDKVTSKADVRRPLGAKTPNNKFAGASTHSLRGLDIIRSYFGNHRLVAKQTIQNLIRSFGTSTMTWMVIGVALGLPAMLFILLDNAEGLGGDWQGKPGISVYLQVDVSESEGRLLAQRLAAEPEFIDARYISAAQALEEFKEHSGFDEVLNSLPGNPLPAVIDIEPDDVSTIELKMSVQRLQELSAVESVSIDLEWIERLIALVTLGERFVLALAIFLGLGVLLSIGNTIRLAIENRRAEIEIIKLVGGTDRFVRRPFLYLGFWYGIGGALFAWLMVQGSLLFLSAPIEDLIYSYRGEFAVKGMGLLGSALLFLTGAGLGVVGAGLAVGRHLHEIEPS